MDFVTLNPSENKVQNSKSDTVVGNFGGNREVTSDISESQDYTKRNGEAINIKKNPIDTTEKDVDEIDDIKSLTTEPSEKSDEMFTKSDYKNRPSEESDSSSKLPNHFGDGQYDN